MNDILTDVRMNFASSSTRRLRTMVTALLTAAGLLLPALGAASTPPAELNSTESLLVGSWEGDLLTDLAHAWPNGDKVPPGQRTREIVELRADRTVVVHPRCVDHHDGIVVYIQAFQLRWSVTPDQVLRWHSNPVAADVLGGTIPMVIEGSTLRLPGGVGKELVLTRYTGELPPPECQIQHGGPAVTSRSLQRGCLIFGARVRGSVQRLDPATCCRSRTTAHGLSAVTAPRILG